MTPARYRRTDGQAGLGSGASAGCSTAANRRRSSTWPTNRLVTLTSKLTRSKRPIALAVQMERGKSEPRTRAADLPPSRRAT